MSTRPENLATDPTGFVRRLREEANQLREPFGPGPAGSSFLPASAAVLSGETSPGFLHGYTFGREIHRGGQGVVYEAIQNATRRQVAIKVFHGIKTNSRAARRFEREAELITQLRHPNVVTVLDAGEREGVFFLIMEHVDGVPIDQYVAAKLMRSRGDTPGPGSADVPSATHFASATDCADVPSAAGHADILSAKLVGGAGILTAAAASSKFSRTEKKRRKAALKELLRLFAQVCDGVAAAHLKGIIHRDLKPANILVDAEGQPRVLDFGLAKVAGELAETGEPLAETGEVANQSFSTLGGCTRDGQFVGSLPWASPEQAIGDQSKIDIRTDVYSLGVLLYQLLTGGRFPYEIQGTVRDVRERIAKAIPDPLFGQCGSWRQAFYFETDLQAIVLKSLSKNPDGRYQSAGETAADIRRCLSGEAIKARRYSRLYVWGKAFRRHWAAVAAATSGLSLLSVGFIATGILWQNAEHARNAESEQRARAQAVTEFLKDLLTAADPARTKGERLTVRESLDAAAERIAKNPPAGQPMIEAEIRSTIGNTYFMLGQFPQALAQLVIAESILARQLGDEHADVLRMRSRMAQCYAWRGDHVRAVELARPTWERQRRLLGNDHPETLRTLSFLGYAMFLSEEYFIREPTQLLREALAGQTRSLGREHEDTLETLLYLAWVLAYESDESLSLAEEVIEIATRTLGADHPHTLYAMQIVSLARSWNSDWESAEANAREVLAATRRVFGDTHHRTADSLGDLSWVLANTGRIEEALQLSKQAAELARSTYGPGTKWAIRYQRIYADVLTNANLWDAALLEYEAALQAARAEAGEEDFETLNTQIVYANTLARRGRVAEAFEQTGRGLEIARRKSGPGHKWSRDFARSHASNLWALGRVEEAMDLLRESLHDCRRIHGDNSLQILSELNNGAIFLRTRGRPAEAEPLAREAWDGYRLTPPSLRRSLGNPAFTLALILKQLDQPVQALEIGREAALCPRASAQQLNYLAWEILTTPLEEYRDAGMALAWAKSANELSAFRNPAYLDTLALAFHRTGDTVRATEIQKKALSILAANDPDRAEYESRLCEFEDALATTTRAADP